MANLVPTQQLPSWMTLSTIVITNAAGSPVATTYSTLQLPLTYYGPSIPLGTNGVWVYGGPSSPAASATVTSTGVASASSAISFSSLSSSSIASAFTSTATSTSSSQNLISTSSSALSIASPSASASSSPVSYPSSGLSKDALIGIIIGSILGSILLLAILIFCLRWRARRRNMDRQVPIWTGWEFVGSNGSAQRVPGEGSPRGSGDEADSFLQRSANTANIRESLVSDVPVPPVGVATTGQAPSGTSGSNNSSSTTESTIISDYGVLLTDTGRSGFAYEPPARPSSDTRGHIVPPSELLRIDENEQAENASRPIQGSIPEIYSPLMPPPPLNVERSSPRRPSNFSLASEKEKSTRSASYPVSELEDSKILTARRVRVQELAPRSNLDNVSPPNTYADFTPVPIPGPSTSSRWRSSLGLSSLTRLGTLAWFKNLDTPSRRNSRSRPNSTNGRTYSDKDLEAGKALLGSDLQKPVYPAERPISSISTKSAISGNSIYHDAASHVSTPVSLPSRALTPAGQNRWSNRYSRISGGAAQGNFSVDPPAYDDPYEVADAAVNINPSSNEVDVLDLPAPRPASPFATRNNTPLPPGLVPLPSPGVWRNSSSDQSGSANTAGIVIDVLDAEPPTAGPGWKYLSSGDAGDTNVDERRATFGVPQVVRQGDLLVSEQGSLHTHLSPRSPHSSGSAAASSRRAFSGSNAGSNSPRLSVISAQSQMRSTSSGASVNSGSGTFESRRRGPISPAVSAFGPMTGNFGQQRDNEEPEGQRISVLGPMPSFTSRSVTSALRPDTIRSVGTSTGTGTTESDTEGTRTTMTIDDNDEVLEFPSVPQHTGLDREIWERVRTEFL